jgi:hypothetical protein
MTPTFTAAEATAGAKRSTIVLSNTDGTTKTGDNRASLTDTAIAIAAATDNLWIAPLIGLVIAVPALLLSTRTVRTWDDTQLSYRLKRRKRLG